MISAEGFEAFNSPPPAPPGPRLAPFPLNCGGVKPPGNPPPANPPGDPPNRDPPAGRGPAPPPGNCALAPAGPADGIAPSCALVTVARLYAAGAANPMNSATATIATLARFASGCPLTATAI